MSTKSKQRQTDKLPLTSRQEDTHTETNNKLTDRRRQRDTERCKDRQTN